MKNISSKGRLVIVTLPGNFNIGNRLQNYALQTVIESMGYVVDNIWLDSEVSIKRQIKDAIKNIMPPIAETVKIHKIHKFREARIGDFTKQYIHNIIHLKIDELNDKKWDEYDYAVTGSDQVWHNTVKSEKELRFYYLTFMEQKKRISYAPSFGFSTFNEEDRDIHKKGLDGIEYLSCREIDGCRMIKKLTGKTAKLVVDPTFLLSKEQWLKIAEKPDNFKISKYMLTYFLGTISEELTIQIEKFSDDNGLKIIKLNDMNSTEFFCINPQEFLWLFAHADYIVTDSFHGTVFSIIFNKKFLVTKRMHKKNEDMFGRIESILSIANRLDAIYELEVFFNNNTYPHYSDELDHLIDFSKHYLREALTSDDTKS